MQITTIVMRRAIIFLISGLVMAVSLSQCSALFGYGNDADQEKVATLSKEAKLRKDIITYAKKRLGDRYQYAGRSPGAFDCSGLVWYVMRNFDIEVSTSSRSQAKEGMKIKEVQAQTGDLVFFRRTPASKVFHVALIVENTSHGVKVIHSTSRGVVIDNISESKYWAPKISEFRDVVSSAL